MWVLMARSLPERAPSVAHKKRTSSHKKRTNLGVVHTTKYGRFLSFDNVVRQFREFIPAETFIDICFPLGAVSVYLRWVPAWEDLQQRLKEIEQQIEVERANPRPAHFLDEYTPLELLEQRFGHYVMLREGLLRVRDEVKREIASGNGSVPICFRTAEYDADDVFAHESTHALLHYALPLVNDADVVTRDTVMHKALSAFLPTLGPASTALWEDYGRYIPIGSNNVEETLTALVGTAKLMQLEDAGVPDNGKMALVLQGYESYIRGPAHFRDEMRETLRAAGREVNMRFATHFDAFDAFYPVLRKKMEKVSQS